MFKYTSNKADQLRVQGHHFEYQNYLDEIVPKDVGRALADNPVSIPDVKSVYLGIESLAMNIRPFDELNQFRTRCFLSFASHQKRDLTLTQVLKLYVAAYQVRCLYMHSPAHISWCAVITKMCRLYQIRTIWKQLWTSVYPVISPQIIRDVETFVEKTPFAIKPFLEILKTSSPF